MVAERRSSIAESMAYFALFFSLLRPDLQEQITLNQASNSPLAISSSPYNLTGLAFSPSSETSCKIESWKEALTYGEHQDPLSQYLNWQPDIRFDNDAVAMIFSDSTQRNQLGSLGDSESGYSSDEAKSPLSTSSYSEPDLSDLGAVGYTPPSDLTELLNSFEDYVDLDSFQTTEPHKGILDVQDSNQFDFSGNEGKEELNYYSNKLSPSDTLLYFPELKTSPDESGFEDSFGMELENKFFDPFTIDFGNTITNSSFQIDNEGGTEMDLDSLAALDLDFGLPLDILNPTHEIDYQVESQNNLLVQEPVTTRENGRINQVPLTSVTADDGIKSLAIPTPPRKVNTLPTFPANEKQKVKREPLTSKDTTNSKSKRDERLPFGVSEQKIVDMPVSEFNIFLEKLSEEEANLVREVRRRGKNKEAARICRKRKIDVVDSLSDELELMKNEKRRILEERRAILEETSSLKSKIKELESSVISSLRDENGAPLSPLEYSIFQGPNGATYVGKTISNKDNTS